MPDVKIKVVNLDEFMAALAKSPAIVGRHISKAVAKAGYAFEAATKQNIRTGREMWKAPIDTGRMWSGIQTQITPFVATITSPIEYSIFVHEGTQYMQARPFFEITENTEERNINKIFEDGLNDALKEVARG